MSLRLVTPSDIAIVSRDEAKAHLRIFHDDDDTYIDGLVATASDWLAGENNWLGRGVIKQQWELTLDCFPCGRGRVNLPKPPLFSIEGVFYTPSVGAETEITSFRELDVGVSNGGYVLPAVNAVWPVTSGEPGSVRIAFTAGYETVPPSVKHAALLMVGHWFENREAVTTDQKGLANLPLAVDTLLFPYRSWVVQPHARTYP
ncbi:head-tail connector protein [Rhizobium rhizogenes]|uniref:head-tail connector protein n=1 Tax=Rhizobium rhizogenes TaxID=359 RepID=UPI0004DAFD4E|nr:head-tail connector protein [Rhizobium rhizogenes]KEA07485.1 hypothetical protein CN09_11305 [Rhizobium rhizogenes]NTJ22241.1 phage gp6-like head-tail connector protein [Rhizobium rhizogenes]QUE80959.1 head-tail connector protein [Rhizobium rhizogenes]TQO80935.1 phage gp6-like head-tail connector protein [Rhizobium rhizogenes]TRB51529.1 phage gp6-like head-tail connector protein [Rhizobium rhizogenes]